jgi:hypothetical protein
MFSTEKNKTEIIAGNNFLCNFIKSLNLIKAVYDYCVTGKRFLWKVFFNIQGELPCGTGWILYLI